MCDFRPGDEVVCIRSVNGREGMTFTVAAAIRVGEVIPSQHRVSVVSSISAVQLDELPWVDEYVVRDRRAVLTWGYDADCFRKVQRRDLTAWVNQSVGNTDKLDKRQPKKVRA